MLVRPLWGSNRVPDRDNLYPVVGISASIPSTTAADVIIRLRTRIQCRIMILRPPFEITALALAAYICYFLMAKRRIKTGDSRICILMAVLWSLWTYCGVLAAIPLIPPPSPPIIPWPSPSPETIFRMHVLFVVLPAISVLVLIVLDLRSDYISPNRKTG